MSDEQAMSKQQLSLAAVAVTSAVATAVSAMGWLGTLLPEPQKGYVVAAGVICSAVHAALLDPKVVAVFNKQ